MVDISAISQVGYVGPAGTWTHQAALDIFGDSVKLVPLEADLFAAYETGEVDALCVPVTTSLVGTTPYVDGLLALRSLFVVAEYPKILSYSLIAPIEATFESITTVMGHPVALEEVTDWLDENMPHVSREARAGTTHHVASLNSPAVASIGPGLGAKLYNLQELRTGIEEGLHNVTRWWVLGREIPACTGDDRTTLHLRTREQEFGSFMRDLAQSGIEILNIYERPTFQGLDDHHYLIDVSGHANDGQMLSFLNGRRHLRILGSYPRCY